VAIAIHVLEKPHLDGNQIMRRFQVFFYCSGVIVSNVYKRPIVRQIRGDQAGKLGLNAAIDY
jgi:hypothetical protein